MELLAQRGKYHSKNLERLKKTVEREREGEEKEKETGEREREREREREKEV